jgi:hypothetical protein
MATRGYDDSETIRRIETLLAAGRYPSRRAAILEIAGPENLRRIERKMGKVDQPASVTADVAIEGAVSEGQAALLMYERQMLDRSGESTLWAAFSSAEIILDRMESSRFISLDRVANYAWHARLAARLVAAPFVMTMIAGLLMTMLGIADTAIVSGLLGADTFGGLLPDAPGKVFESGMPAFVALIQLTMVLMIPFLFFDGIHKAWLWRSNAETLQLQDRAVKESLNRYLLTDRAFYTLSLKGGAVQVTRMSAAKVQVASLDDHGDLILECEGSRVTLEAIPDTADLVLMLSRDMPAAA